jgi:hypothetical protein
MTTSLHPIGRQEPSERCGRNRSAKIRPLRRRLLAFGTALLMIIAGAAPVAGEHAPGALIDADCRQGLRTESGAGGFHELPDGPIVLRTDDPLVIRLTYVHGNDSPTLYAVHFTATANDNFLTGPPHVLDVDTRWGGGGEATSIIKEIPLDTSAARSGQGRITVTIASDATGETVLANCDFTLTLGPDAPRKISSDPFFGDGALHATQVEVDTFGSGDTVVAVFQSGRFATGGGSSAIGFATSRDRGATWTSGFLPELTTANLVLDPTIDPSGLAARATDPSVTYDARHAVWLAASLRLRPPFDNLPKGKSDYAISRSTDGGLTWAAPIIALPPTETPTERDGFFAHDQGRLGCDKTGSSSYYGRCYLVYIDIPAGPKTAVVHSDDGGQTWSMPVFTDGGAGEPLVQPDGDVIVLASGSGAVTSTRSADGGATFEPPVTVAHTQHVTEGPSSAPGLFSPGKPTAEIDASGTIYVAYEDCEFRLPDCSAEDIVYTSSPDGITWQPEKRIPLDPLLHHALPALAVDPTRSGDRARLALSYYSLPTRACTATCPLSVGVIISRNGGISWESPRAIGHAPAEVGWHAYRELSGRRSGWFVGDYGSTSFAGDVALPAFALADRAPADGVLSQSMWAAAFDVTDRLPPTIAVSVPAVGASYGLGDQVASAYTCLDEPGGSGIASCSATVLDPGGTPSALVNGGLVPTSTVGVHTVTFLATDNDGNNATSQRTYVVFASTSGPVDGPPTVNTVKAGRGVPIVFSLGGDRGLSIFAPGYPVSQPIDCGALSGTPDQVESTVATPGGLTYDPATEEYTYVWRTDKAWRGTCREFAIQFAPAVLGGARVTFYFRFT